ncbi:hypothetical protein L210DRAFT_481222 [Boletus edulis BED1]|uniref:Uncharacterized protein n=1 Tax=Boletus edulis BED1 TaxID=1328754 RepID=A0AAD4GGU5_BOLED|nr:hypothetical protein L210DRAFT_481222 [Boletus edulis BED1]
MAINLGNMVNIANYTNNTAYIQLLPITNATFGKRHKILQISDGTRNKSSSPSISNASKSWLIGLIAGTGLLHILFVAFAAVAIAALIMPWLVTLSTPSHLPVLIHGVSTAGSV